MATPASVNKVVLACSSLVCNYLTMEDYAEIFLWFLKFLAEQDDTYNDASVLALMSGRLALQDF